LQNVRAGKDHGLCVPEVWKEKMNPIREFIGGAIEITRWLKDGGIVVEREVAESRASICGSCSKNIKVGWVKLIIASIIKKVLEIKNRKNLSVSGRLEQCGDCGCVLKLLILEEQKRIEPYLTDDDRQKLPAFCWKLKKP
jgi:hypothetical protein